MFYEIYESPGNVQEKNTSEITKIPDIRWLVFVRKVNQNLIRVY